MVFSQPDGEPSSQLGMGAMAGKNGKTPEGEKIQEKDGSDVQSGEVLARVVLGRTLKEMRKRKLLTITQLALYTGLSVGYLSNVERGQTSPTVDNLRKICGELDVSMSEVLEQKPDERPLVRRSDCSVSERPEEGMTVVTYEFGGAIPSYSIITIEPGEHAHSVDAMHPFSECCHMISGELTVTVEGQVHVLKAGDALLVRKNCRHDMYNEGSEPSVSLWYQTREMAK